MATKFEIALLRAVIATGSTVVAYLVGVGIYTLLYGDAYFYNLGYSIGFISSKISSLF